MPYVVDDGVVVIDRIAISRHHVEVRIVAIDGQPLRRVSRCRSEVNRLHKALAKTSNATSYGFHGHERREYAHVRRSGDRTQRIAVPKMDNQQTRRRVNFGPQETPLGHNGELNTI